MKYSLEFTSRLNFFVFFPLLSTQPNLAGRTPGVAMELVVNKLSELTSFGGLNWICFDLMGKSL